MENYYEILGVARDATQQDIKKAYRQLAKKHHPDLNKGSSESEKIFKKVYEAYQILSDTTSREAYDARLNTQNENTTHTNNTFEKKREHQVNYQEFDIRNMEKNFENFFGFNPKTKKMSPKMENKKDNNPVDTSAIFESFFNVRKK
ncbi:MAG TPA: J domain-containing protein [Bacillus bacterium]|nr:J domain-containing protein [Bacillus sp. (in: firmicutes)]